MKVAALILAFVYLSDSVDAQRASPPQSQQNRRVIGLLELPDMTESNFGDQCRSTESTAVQIHASPSKAAARVGIVYRSNRQTHGCGSLLFKRAGTSTEEQFPSEESGYELAAAIVYEQRGRWLRVAVPGGSAWIERRNAKDFLPYPQLLSDRMAYLPEDWDGRLRTGAGMEFQAKRLPIEWRRQIAQEISIELLGIRRIGNEDWMHVRFVDGCVDDPLAESKPVDGWLPAYRPDGTRAARFYSRGC